MGTYRNVGARWAYPIVGVASTSVVIGFIRGQADIPNLATLYLVPVILTAVRVGWWPALGASVLAFLSFDFLFVDPIYTFTVSDPAEWLSLLIFLLVAAVTGNLAARERVLLTQSRRRAEEAILLYGISRTVTSSAGDDVLHVALEMLCRTLGFSGGSVEVEQAGRKAVRASFGDSPRDTGAGKVIGRLSGRSRVARIIELRGAGAFLSAPVLAVPLHAGDRAVGSLRLTGRDHVSDEETALLATVAELLATAIERERLGRAAAKAEILRRTEELQQALLSSVSHDLRTPLASIKASAGTLLATEGEWTEGDRRSLLSTIDREADRLNRIVGNLLDLSRIEAGALKPQKEWYDLAELTREVLARLHGALGDRPVALDIHGTLPPLELDYLMIDQVMTNLIENANKYCPPDTPIEITIGVAGDAMRVTVRDHGPGIPAAARDKVFDKFYRIHPDGKVSGSGFGLSVCRGLIEAHGGDIRVTDTPDGGAAFSFTLPLAAPRAAKLEAAVAS